MILVCFEVVEGDDFNMVQFRLILPSVLAPCTQCGLNSLHIFNKDPQDCLSCTLIEMQFLWPFVINKFAN